jgi:hypothetical protein
VLEHADARDLVVRLDVGQVGVVDEGSTCTRPARLRAAICAVTYSCWLRDSVMPVAWTP